MITQLQASESLMRFASVLFPLPLAPQIPTMIIPYPLPRGAPAFFVSLSFFPAIRNALSTAERSRRRGTPRRFLARPGRLPVLQFATKKGAGKPHAVQPAKTFSRVCF